MDRCPKARSNRRSTLARAAGLILLGCFAAVGWRIWQLHNRARQSWPSDPRLSFATPFRNVRPEVRYVGDRVCAECHADVAETYHRHPMGRSLAPVSQAAVVEGYDRAAGNPFEKDGFEFQVERRDGRVFHRELRRGPEGRTAIDLPVEVRFAIGSGTRGRSYLIDRDGYLFQSLLSWYSQPGVWDLTPGFAVPEQFERPAQAACLFCHANQVEPVADTINRYRVPVFRGYAIGCERCHGPGELHVQAVQHGEDTEGTIVNPGRLAPALRDAVCQQCHLQGEVRVLRRGRQWFDYRPGLPLQLFVSVFVRSEQFATGDKSGSHTEQIYGSRCFRESQGKLGCISCHDPHRLPEPEQKVAYYRRRCLACHTEQSCGLPSPLRTAKVSTDDCIHCHMPRTGSKIAHRAVTDHRIRRRPGIKPRPDEATRRLLPGEIPLVPFFRDQVDPEKGETSRDLGLALVELVKRYPQLARHGSAIALPLLEETLRRGPEDVPAWEAKGFALWQLDRKPEALAAFQAALARTPARELTLSYLAVLAAALGQRDQAIAYWQRALAVNPWMSQYHYRLAGLFAQRAEWQHALEQSESAVNLNPAAPEMRLLHISCLLRTGHADQAGADLDKLLAIRPEDREKILRWFAQGAPLRGAPASGEALAPR
jgi:Flp pilus assembly protein TadD